MKVTLIASTPDAQKIAAAAARVCYSAEPADIIMETISEEKIRKRIFDCVTKGHLSVIEHACYTFSIEGISRVTSHQLVRHRIASFSQQSQRYVKMKDVDSYVTPPAITEAPQLYEQYQAFMKSSSHLYDTFLRAGVSAEDARYILPSAISTNIVVTMNARELLHFFSLRCCKKAQWEIRALAWKMLREAKKASPYIFENAGPDCLGGSCPQDDWKCFEKMKRINNGRNENDEK